MNNQKFKINSIDILLFCIAFVAISLLAISTFADKEMIDISRSEKLEITVSIKDIERKHAGYIKKDDTVYLTQDESVIGKIVSSDLSSSNQLVSAVQTGRSRTVLLPNKVNADIIISCNGVKNGNKYHISGTNFRVGDEIVLSSPDFSGVGVISDISIGE